MGFSMHLMGFPGYYSVCLINKHSLVYFENIAVREGSNMLPFYTWKTEAQESYLRWLMFSLKAFFFKVLLSLKSAAAIDSEYSMVPFSAGKWTRRIWHRGVVCGSGRCHALIHTDPSLAVTPKHGLFCPGPWTWSYPTSFFPSHTSEILFFIPKAVLSVPVSLLSKS